MVCQEDDTESVSANILPPKTHPNVQLKRKSQPTCSNSNPPLVTSHPHSPEGWVRMIVMGKKNLRFDLRGSEAQSPLYVAGWK